MAKVMVKKITAAPLQANLSLLWERAHQILEGDRVPTTAAPAALRVQFQMLEAKGQWKRR